MTILAATWVLGAVCAAGIGLACYYLQERPIHGAARWLSIGHGAAGAIGVALVLLASTPDAQGFRALAGWMLGLALLGGLMVISAQLRRRRPPGLVVALHATLGVAGFVILLAAVR